MRPTLVAFIVVFACFLVGCEKKNSVAPTVAPAVHPVDTPRLVNVYPYTDTFYGVWYNSGDYSDPNEHRDTSFNTVCYVKHISSDSIGVTAGVSIALLISNYKIDFEGFALNAGLVTDSPNVSVFVGENVFNGINSAAITVRFAKDSLFLDREYSADCENWEDLGSFAGKLTNLRR